MERTMFHEAKDQYMYHLVKAGDLDGIVNELQERQAAYCKGNPRLKPVNIDHKPSLQPGTLFEYIHIGASSFTLIEVQGEIPQK